VRFLGERLDGDCWRGFPTLAGLANTWVTGFVVAHLALVRPAPAFLQRARRFLVAHRTGGAWSYGPGVPVDADSTAWCLAALRGSRLLPSAARRAAEQVVGAHTSASGVSTYLADSGIVAYIGANDASAVVGWTAPHADVTAAVLAAGLLESEDAVELLRGLLSRQTAAGFIESYWWRSPYYATALALRACVVRRQRPADLFIPRLLRALDGRRFGGYELGGGTMMASAFNTALALEAYAHSAAFGGRQEARAVAADLCAMQLPSGGWQGQAPLRIPAPHVLDPRHVKLWGHGGGGNSLVQDSEGLFATALATHALALHLAAEAGKYSGIDAGWPALEPPSPAPDATVAQALPDLPPEQDRC
jgi:hypothetical protein